jgi:hypothetical protein
MSRVARAKEPAWQTTRVVPGRLASSADRSDRTFGTAPPAAGETPVSGRGSGQKAVRSM